MKKNITKVQLFDYFEGRASLQTKRAIEAWLEQPESQELYFQWLEEYERQHQYWQPNSDAELEKVQARMREMSQLTEPVIDEVPIQNPWKKWAWAVAASVAILIVAGFAFQEQWLYRTYKTQFGALQNVTLEDGTVVHLNANSSLRVPRFGFGSSSREVLLNGEAYFSVKHTPTHQKFIVRTNQNFSVEVLGTEFDVRKRGAGMQVVLDKGKVKVHYGQTNSPIVMKPGDKVTLNEQGKAQIEQVKHAHAYSAWRTNRFVFDKTSLQEVGRLLQDNFGVKVTIPESLANRSLSGEIVAHDADELVEALTLVFELKIVKQNKQLLILEK